MQLPFIADSSSPYDVTNSSVGLRCPRCRQNGSFEALAVQDLFVGDVNGDVHIAGMRRCPDPECHALIFFALEKLPDGGNGAFTTLPPETVDFDSTDIPAAVVGALEEAITCHAQRCYKAAAMMVRKTLEEMCHDL